MPTHLTDFFRLVLVASWQSSLIVLLILLVRPLLGASVPARWRYLLWTLVLIRLLVPISVFPSNPVSMQNIAVVDQPFDRDRRPRPVFGQLTFMLSTRGEGPGNHRCWRALSDRPYRSSLRATLYMRGVYTSRTAAP